MAMVRPAVGWLAGVAILASGALRAETPAPPAGASPPSTGAPAPSSEAPAAFDARYGPDLARVAATADTKDDAALAARLLADAQAADVPPALLPLLCERAYDLGLKDPDGSRTAIAAMDLLAARAPDQKAACEEKALGVYQSLHQRARGAERIRAAEEYVGATLRYADARTAARDYEGAVSLYRRATPVAPAASRAVSREELQAKLDFALTRLGFQKQAERLQASLADDPTRKADRDELVRLHVVEFDDPAAAARHLDLKAEDVANKYVLAATVGLDRLPERACVELGHWYRGLADKASPQGRLIALTRAQAYYERFLEVHTAEDDGRAEAARALDDMDGVLAKTGPGPARITLLPFAEFERQFGAALPPARNVASGGRAAASSHWGSRLPQGVFAGQRIGDAWSLNGPSGTFEAAWTPAAKGRYLLLFARTSTPGTDPWGDAMLTLNGARAYRLDGVCSGRVVLIDLGMAFPIQTLKIEIRGSGYPGLAGIEVHRRMEP